jgi:hypothetical protein
MDVNFSPKGALDVNHECEIETINHKKMVVVA